MDVKNVLAAKQVTASALFVVWINTCKYLFSLGWANMAKHLLGNVDVGV